MRSTTRGMDPAMHPALRGRRSTARFAPFFLLLPVFALMAVCTGAGAAIAQDGTNAPTPPPTPCASEEARRLDFWLGEWDLRWEGGHGTNSITRRFGDCVIEENFEGTMPTGIFRGHSVSVWDARRGIWRQTWVDNRGGYLVFEGGVEEDGILRLYGEERTLPDGSRARMRMAWLDVRPDSLQWHWQRSVDGGATWETVWLIHYQRRNERR